MSDQMFLTEREEGKLNLYEVALKQDGTDLVTIIEVAAPDARKAMATIVASNTGDYAPIRCECRAENVMPEAVPDGVLVWTPDQGYLVSTTKGDKLPSEATYAGVLEVRE